MDAPPAVWDARRVAMASKTGMLNSWGRTRWFAGALPIGVLALILALAVIALSACGDDDEQESGVSFAALNSSLPAAGELELDDGSESKWRDATDLLGAGLVIGAATKPNQLGTAIEDAGFQGAVSRNLEGPNLNVRISAAQFDSEDGALTARDLLHKEDLKQPCAEACAVAPQEYELDDVPDSAAVHHVPIRESKVEAHHAEFVIGSRLYVVQVDGRPSSTFSADFDKLMRTVHRSASSAE